MAAKKTAKTAKKSARPSAKPAATKTARKAARAAADRGLALGGVSPSFTVNDVEKSLAWYRDVLGFSVGQRWEGGGQLLGVEMHAGGVIVMLAQDDWKKGRDRVKGEGFRIYCDTTQDVDALAARIKARGGTLAQEPRDEPWGARALAVEDPDGFKITIARQKR